MKILQVHKYFTKKRGGGSVTAFLEMVKMLEKKGHAVSIFSMQDPQNEATPFAKYFPSHFDLNAKSDFWRKIRLFGKLIYNQEAKKKIAELIKVEHPDIAHLHNIYHYLTLSILSPLKKKRIPVVMTLHDYKIICPNYKLFNHGKICEKCKGGKYYHCFFNKCLKNSWSASFVVMFEAYLHKILKSYDQVDLFLAPSDFMRNKCIEFGIAPKKIQKMRYPFDFGKTGENQENIPEKNYFLFYGRLSEEKGLKNLIQAVKKLVKNGKMSNDQLLIVGKGPQETELKVLVKRERLENKIIFTGFKEGLELQKIISAAKFVVVPSVWYDNSPLVVIESQFYGKPVVVSDRGGTKESIIENQSGLVFEAENIADLAQKISQLLKLTYAERWAMGQTGKENIQKINNTEEIYQDLLETYRKLSLG
jgi:glycosyltransferase involved in cell wall biosynthesis